MANREEQLKQITDQLEQGVSEIFTSEKYTEYLQTMAKFHNYSFNNTLLIAMQKPEATLVAGYQAWQKKFNRQVKRGEKGIQIIAPAPYKEKQEIEKTDPETGEIVIGEDGQPETEVVERVVTKFRVTTVFDVSQTTGEPIPEFEVSELDGDVLIYHDFMEALKTVWDFFQNEVLGMGWLNRLISTILNACGLDTTGKIGGSVQFFIYDTIKIMVLLGVLILIISYIQSYFPPERTKKILGRFHGVGANIIAALLGTVTPFCSCSSIPLFIGFTSAGLPLGVTFSFLISSPMVDLGSLVLLMSIFGWKVAVLYVVLGLVIAVAGGTLIEKLHLDNQVEEYIRNGHAMDVPQEELHFKDRMKFAWEQVVETAKKVAPYVLIGVGIGAFIHNWIPEEFIVKVLGDNNPFGVILATIAGIPMYADIFGTIPIAEALLAKGALLGVVLSFMMGVTTLSLPSMIMLRKAVKPKLLGIFIAICTAGIIIVGYLFNVIQPLII